MCMTWVVESQTSVTGNILSVIIAICLHENYINIKQNNMKMIQAELEPYKSVFRRWRPTHLQGKTSLEEKTLNNNSSYNFNINNYKVYACSDQTCIMKHLEYTYMHLPEQSQLMIHRSSFQ